MIHCQTLLIIFFLELVVEGAPDRTVECKSKTITFYGLIWTQHKHQLTSNIATLAARA